MLIVTDDNSANSTLLVVAPISEISDANDIVTLNTKAPATEAEPAVDKFTLYLGAVNKVKLPALTGLEEMQSVRLQNGKHFELKIYKNDGTTLYDTMQPGQVKTYRVSGGAWEKE